MMKKIVFCLLCIMSANAAHALNLWQAYQLALDSDPTFLAAKYDLESSGYDVDIAKSAIRPNLSANANASDQTVEFSDNTTNNSNTGAGLGLTWLLFDQATRIQIQQSDLQLAVDEFTFESANQSLITRTAQAYFDVLSAEDQHEVSEAAYQTFKRQLDQAQERLDVGLGTRTDVFDTQARLDQAEADLITTQNQIDINRENLAQIIGIYPEQLAPLMDDESLLAYEQPLTKNKLTERAEKLNVSVNIAAINTIIAEKEIDKQRAARWPSLNLNANYDWDSSSPTSDSNNETRSAQLTLSLPIYSGGAISARTRKAAFDYQSAQQSLNSSRRQAKTDVASAYLSINSAKKSIAALEQAVKAGEEALRARQETYDAGLSTNIDVLDAQRELSLSRSNLLAARYNFILQTLELERATGTLDANNLQEVNTWLATDLLSTTPKSE